ncbi:RHS repeat-associated core domain-containing protein, partial [Kutzneria sp. 744]|uniref:RHS repeat-associated core domain-containing protein n=1 Tax=Kutzneria sp. (strain 744) TaxID=345341 RepID=UPI000693B295
DKASPLSPSASWDVSAQTGDFSWSYPLRVPPSPGGLDPKLALSYASSGVDGRTSATNNQASWVGDGWDLSVGFIERSYVPCADDTTPVKVGDLCWRSDNAFASYGGGGGQLIRDDKTGAWRNKTDDGSRIERLTGAANGDNDGEYWRITTVDGTQYYFGDRPDAKSALTVPVFGNDAGEPCHGATFDASRCTQAWRWNLDKVVDRHGNMIQYNYDAETNSYGADNKDAAASYVRGGTLKEALYGLRDGTAQQASARVEFATADRCVPGSDCTPDKKDNWPDVPWADKCDGPTCKDQNSPSFWTTKRLSKITTQVLAGSTYSDVESWSLDQQFPASGDGEKPALWLKSVTHTGLAGGTPVALPSVRFEGTKMANRVDKVDGLGPLLRYRLTAVVSETGGVTTITYAAPDCTADTVPAKAETNTQRCFPMKWAKKDFSERTDYFNKYVVAQVAESDMIAANTEDVTSYDYLDGAAWAYDTSEFTKDANRNWNEFHGFGRVRITKGKAGDLSGPQTMTEERFYRGMDGDKQPTGTRSVTVTDSEGGARKDDAWLQGFEYESQVHNGTSDQIISKSVMTPSVQGPTATRGNLKAYMVKTGTTANYAALSAGGWRTTRTEQAYDDLGQLVSTNDLGDIATPADDRCTRTSYVRNTDKWLIASPSQTETVSVACTATPKYPDNAVSGHRYSYDGKAFGTAPVTGDATRIEVLDSYPASGAVYILDSTSVFDAQGRVTSAGDALGRVTTTAYTPATGGPQTQTVVTNPAGQSVTTTLETAYGQPTKVTDANNRVTETTYDALGRKTEHWLPNRSRSAGVAGNEKYSYAYRADGPTVVATSSIGPNGNYTTSNELYDGLMRLRQTQAPADGGRLITDIKYDSQGRQYKSTKPYFNAAPVDDKLVIASDVDVALQTDTEFDGAGRKTADVLKGGAFEKWRTITAYDGDSTTVTPPVGGTATMSIVDARGKTIELRQYHGHLPTGDYDTTKYAYDPEGRLTTTTDPAGSTWHRAYDLRGNEIRDDDVDKGTSTMTYDGAGQQLTSTDARGTTLYRAYDDLGRTTSIRTGSATGPIQAQWIYDTASFGKGQIASSTRYVNGNAYTTAISGYNALYKPIGAQVTVPDSEGALAGTYASNQKYNVDGTLSGVGYAAAGDLPAESVTTARNDLGQITTVTGGFDGNTADYVTDTTYTRYGEVARTQLGDTGKRVWLSNYYDDNTRQVDRTIVDAEVPSPMLSDKHYSYDPSGNVTSIADTPQGKPADVQCFTLDYLQRITEAWTPSGDCTAAPSAAALGGPAPYWQSFSYNKVGDRLSETQHGTAGDTVTTGAFPATGHSLSGVSSTGPSGPSASQFVYDASGNTVTRKLPGATQQLDWDAEGHLAKITQGSDVTDFVYDATGNRLIRHDSTGATLFLDGQELHLAKSTGKLEATRYYLHGDAAVAMRTAAGLTWLAGDTQGTAQIAVTSDSLQVTQRRQTPFGEPRGAAVDFPGEKGFVGGTLDKSVGLTQLGAREYDPALGRFLSVDPVADPNDAQQLHGYTYADNNPITKSDPDGQIWGWLKSAWNATTKFVDDHRSWLGVAAGVLAFASGPVGWIALGVSTALTMRDMWIATKNHDSTSFILDTFSFGLGGAAAGFGKLAANAAKAAEAAQAATKTPGVLNLAANRVANAGARSLDRQGNILNVGALGETYIGPAVQAIRGEGITNNPSAEGLGGEPPAAAAVPPTNWSCSRPGFAGPYPCTNRQGNPMANSYCHAGGVFCVLPPRAPTAAGPKFPSFVPFHRAPSYNLGPDKPGPNRPTYNSAEAIRTGIYQTTDGLYHNRSGHGLAFF